MTETTWIPPVFGIVGLIVAFIIFGLVKRYDEGDEKIKKIADAIHTGAMVFMRREYTMLAMFAGVLLVMLYFALGIDTAIAFLVGALAIATAGWIGMYTATKANVRTTTAAHTDGAAAALSVAFFGGSIMGLTVASMGLLGLGFLYYLFGGDPETAHHIHGFGMGASTVALFSRVGGGIYTKSADVGADLVGKVEAGIPEDDPRNPGVIADNVGDNVGDVAGMGSDIFESYCGSMIATIAIASTLALAGATGVSGLAPGVTDADTARGVLMALPLFLASTGLICALVGIASVRALSNQEPALALRIGTIGSPLLFIIVAWFVIGDAGLSSAIWWSVVSGAVGGIVIGLVTEYYTSSTPIVRIAEAGETGSATVMITGLAVGMQSVAIPVLAICGIIFVSPPSPASTASASPRSACWPPSVSPWPSMLTDPSPTTPAALQRWAVSGRKPARSPTHSTSSATRPPPSARDSPSARRRSRRSRSSRPTSRPSLTSIRRSACTSAIRKC